MDENWSESPFQNGQNSTDQNILKRSLKTDEIYPWYEFCGVWTWSNFMKFSFQFHSISSLLKKKKALLIPDETYSISGLSNMKTICKYINFMTWVVEMRVVFSYHGGFTVCLSPLLHFWVLGEWKGACLPLFCVFGCRKAGRGCICLLSHVFGCWEAGKGQAYPLPMFLDIERLGEGASALFCEHLSLSHMFCAESR